MRKLLIICALAVAWVALGAWAASRLLHQGYLLCLLGAAVAGLYVIVVWAWAHGRRARKRVGALLVTCGPNPLRLSRFVYAGMQATVALIIGAAEIDWQRLTFDGAATAASSLNESPWLPFLLTTGLLACALGALKDGLGRVELREAGIWTGASLLPWGSIRYHLWESETTVAVALDDAGIAVTVLRIPPELKESVQHIISARCPNKQDVLHINTEAPLSSAVQS